MRCREWIYMEQRQERRDRLWAQDVLCARGSPRRRPSGIHQGGYKRERSELLVYGYFGQSYAEDRRLLPVDNRLCSRTSLRPGEQEPCGMVWWRQRGRVQP